MASHCQKAVSNPMLWLAPCSDHFALAVITIMITTCCFSGMSPASPPAHFVLHVSSLVVEMQVAGVAIPEYGKAGSPPEGV